MPAKIPPHLFKKAQEEFKKKFTPGFYHGSSSSKIKEFDPYHKPSPQGSSSWDEKQTPLGVTFVSPSPKFAESFLPINSRTSYVNPPFKSGATMYPVSVNLGKHFDYEDPSVHKLIEQYADNKILEDMLKSGDWASMENPNFLKLLREQGYDTFATREGGVKNIGIFNPKNIRGKFAEYNPEQAESADFMKARGGLVHLAKGKQVKKALEFILPPAENAARTQIIGTLPTYRKAADIFQSRGAEGRGLDFGAGLGEGAKVMPGRYETYEPFASGWSPTYSDISQIPEEAYNRLTNLNVLNVVPREARDEIVQGIGRSMEPGGMGIITTRGKDVMSAKGRPGPEPMSIITSRETYQKGFTPAELQEYLRYMLGEGYDIERLGLGPAGAMIRKKAEGGLSQYAKGGHATPAWQRKEGKNPEGGLNAAGRASYNRETGGNLKAPQPEGGPRRDSFCARMKGMKKKLTSAKTANDPDSRINKSLRKWKC